MIVRSKETVNIVTYNNGTISSLFSFDTDENSVKGAEQKFLTKIKDYEKLVFGEVISDEDSFELYLDEGYYESSDEVFEVYIYWSDKSEVNIVESSPIIKEGSKVMWSGAWGSHDAKEATIESIERTKKEHEKYGEEVEEVTYTGDPQFSGWDFPFICTLDNGHWAYSYQIKPMGV